MLIKKRKLNTETTLTNKLTDLHKQKKYHEKELRIIKFKIYHEINDIELKLDRSNK